MVPVPVALRVAPSACYHNGNVFMHMHMQGEVTPGGGGHRSKARHGANSAHREGYGRPRAWLDERDDDAGEGGGDEGGGDEGADVAGGVPASRHAPCEREQRRRCLWLARGIGSLAALHWWPRELLQSNVPHVAAFA